MPHKGAIIDKELQEDDEATLRRMEERKERMEEKKERRASMLGERS